MKQIHSFTTFRNVALSYSELMMIIRSRDFYVLGHNSNNFASLWAKTVMKLETVLTTALVHIVLPGTRQNVLSQNHKHHANWPTGQLCMIDIINKYHRSRVKRTLLTQFSVVPLRTRRALFMYRMYGVSALLVLIGTWLTSFWLSSKYTLNMIVSIQVHYILKFTIKI